MAFEFPQVSELVELAKLPAPGTVTQLCELVLLTGAYAAIDYLVRRDGWIKFLKLVGLAKANLPALLWLLVCGALMPFISWTQIPQGDLFRYLSLGLSLMLAWQAATKDIDPVIGESHAGFRILVIFIAIGSFFNPALLLAAGFLLTTPFGIWQHHATLPMRIIQALMAYICLSPAFSDSSVAVFFILTIAVSHYLITALAKCLLGPKWYSWVTDNRLHHIAANAYSWGWARFLPWSVWHRVIQTVKPIDKPLQFAAFSIELLSPLAFLHPYVAAGLLVAWAGFHGGVFALSGLLFWDWILTDLALAALILLLPPAVTSQVFGPWSVLAAIVFMGLFPLRHKLWKPMPLGWFDTPFTQRIHWRVRGESGKEYGLYNDFMCPHERLYGKVNGCFLAPVPVITYHLGEVWKPDLRDAICAAGPSLENLAAVRERFGITPRCEDREANHRSYLRDFFYQLNNGARKHVFPTWLRWLKAPGDQIFYWGDLPPYKRQEKITQVTLHYREEYYDGKILQKLRQEQVMEIFIDQERPPQGSRELTPKELDDFLLGHAAGRLIDLPGFGGGYVKGDDGKAKTT